jgi:adenylate cyclase
MTLRRMSDIEFSRERARSGDIDGAIDLAATVLAEQIDTGEMIFRGPATTVLVEALLARGGPGDVEAAERAIDRLEDVPTEPGFVLHEIPVLRLRALLARVRGDESGYRQFLQGFRAKAQDVQFEGYLAQAEAMDAD